MLGEQDKFYQQLPFTLPHQQSKPSYTILGTGLQECLIAAHFSKMHLKQGLILDIDKTYGSCLKTVTLKQLHLLATLQEQEKLYTFIKLAEYEQSNNQYYQHCIENKAFRGYNIDIEPNFFFADSPACELLREADMDKYMDFRLVNRMLYYNSSNSKQGTQLKNVPLSKGKIFESKDLSLLQKKLLLSSFHSLAQIYHKYNNVEHDQNSTKQFDKDFGQVDQKLYKQFMVQKNNIFYEFVNEKIAKKNKKIMDYMVYIICNYQYNYNSLEGLPAFIRDQYTLEKFIKRFGKFLKSCGVYGQGPYLYVDNGIGDVPQSYSRIASIFGATYILHPKITINKICEDNQTKTIKIYTNLCPQGFIETQKLYIGPTFYDYYENSKKENAEIKPQQQEGEILGKQKQINIKYNVEYILRVLILFSKNEVQGEQQQYPSITYLLDLDKQIFSNPVYLFMLDQTSHSCPKGLLLYQFETLLNAAQSTQPNISELYSNKISLQVDKLIETMAQIQNDKQIKNRLKYVTAYIREKRYPKQINEETYGKQLQNLLIDHNGIDLDSHFVNFKRIVTAAGTVGKDRSYFRKEVQGDGGNEGDGQYHAGQDYETVDLVDRLNQINFTSKVQEQVENNQTSTPDKKQEETKQNEKQKQEQIKQNEKQEEIQQKQNEKQEQDKQGKQQEEE